MCIIITENRNVHSDLTNLHVYHLDETLTSINPAENEP